MMARLLVVCFAAVVAGQSGTTPAPIALHTPNPHYFLWRGKPAVLIALAEHYGALVADREPRAAI